MVMGTGRMAQRVWPLMVSVVALHWYSTLVAATPQGATSSSIHHSVFSNRWQKMIRRRRVLACVCNEFPYQFLNNKIRFLTWCHSNQELDVKPTCMLNTGLIKICGWLSRGCAHTSGERLEVEFSELGTWYRSLQDSVGEGHMRCYRNQHYWPVRWQSINIHTCWSDDYLFFPGHWKNHLD